MYRTNADISTGDTPANAKFERFALAAELISQFWCERGEQCVAQVERICSLDSQPNTAEEKCELVESIFTSDNSDQQLADPVVGPLLSCLLAAVELLAHQQTGTSRITLRQTITSASTLLLALLTLQYLSWSDASRRQVDSREHNWSLYVSHLKLLPNYISPIGHFKAGMEGYLLVANELTVTAATQARNDVHLHELLHFDGPAGQMLSELSAWPMYRFAALDQAIKLDPDSGEPKFVLIRTPTGADEFKLSRRLAFLANAQQQSVGHLPHVVDQSGHTNRKQFGCPLWQRCPSIARQLHEAGYLRLITRFLSDVDVNYPDRLTSKIF